LLLQQQLIFIFLVWRYLNMGIAVIPAAGGGVTQKVQEFTSTGTFTVPSNCSSVEVFLVAGGGGGGGAGVTNASGNASSMAGGGGGGVTLKRMLTVTPGQAYTVTIGAGGTAGTSSSNSGVGGNTSFGSLLVASGGGGGAGSGGWGTSPVSYISNINGGTGGGGMAGAAGSFAFCGGFGGATLPTYVDNFSQWGNVTNSSVGTGSQGTKGLNAQGAAFTTTSNWITGTGLENYGNAGYPAITGNANFQTTNILSWGNTIQYTNNSVGGSSPVAITGNSGAANTGNAGNGGLAFAGSPPSTQNGSGGAGGSGYARITYWS
jgi:hypothetical protein